MICIQFDPIVVSAQDFIPRKLYGILKYML